MITGLIYLVIIFVALKFLTEYAIPIVAAIALFFIIHMIVRIKNDRAIKKEREKQRIAAKMAKAQEEWEKKQADAARKKANEGYKFLAFDVAGVTLKNTDDDWKRQDILQYIDEQMPPFVPDSLTVSFNEYTIENVKGISVLINGHKIGDIPHKQIGEYYDAIESGEYSIAYFDVFKDDETHKYQCTMSIKYKADEDEEEDEEESDD